MIALGVMHNTSPNMIGFVFRRNIGLRLLTLNKWGSEPKDKEDSFNFSGEIRCTNPA